MLLGLFIYGFEVVWDGPQMGVGGQGVRRGFRRKRWRSRLTTKRMRTMNLGREGVDIAAFFGGGNIAERV